jgi:hypothetical protein
MNGLEKRRLVEPSTHAVPGALTRCWSEIQALCYPLRVRGLGTCVSRPTSRGSDGLHAKDRW